MNFPGVLAYVLAFLMVNSNVAVAQTFPQLAEQKLHEFSSVEAPSDSETVFELNVEFPATLGPKPFYPWEAIDFTEDPEEYMNAVKAYILADTDLVNRDFAVADSKRWFHAPWLRREPVHGLTLERRSRVGELWPGQPDRIQNWAVSFYNDRGAYTVGQVWEDPAAPNTEAARFPIGALGFKLLFTEATDEQVPYLSGSKTWEAYIDQTSGQNTEMRLLQFDIAVRDSRADALTGWVFGTFMYFDKTHQETDFSWDNVIPVTLAWGSDPDLLQLNYNAGATPQESWTNDEIGNLFAEVIRTKENGFDSPHLGLFGRANGPVDNPRSSCVACHGRAIDLGEARSDEYWKEVLPFAPSVGASDFEIQWFFRNLSPDEPFLHEAVSLDYSLQLQVGVRRFRNWQDSLTSLGAFISYNAAVPKGDELQEYLDRVNQVEPFIPERGGAVE
ncbi:hypothetical protein [Tateyamaria sp.]|uniref:hypothetical protein n=1 Tax=Tateyamaria sp. TaxID=1929288 RepID=UPI00329AB104